MRLWLGAPAVASADPRPLSLHDALPISHRPIAPQIGDFEGRRGTQRDERRVRLLGALDRLIVDAGHHVSREQAHAAPVLRHGEADRKTTRLNSSHVKISYAVFCVNT